MDMLPSKENRPDVGVKTIQAKTSILESDIFVDANKERELYLRMFVDDYYDNNEVPDQH